MFDVNINDIINFNVTMQMHDKHLHRVFEWLKTHGLKLQFKIHEKKI
jgi:hypothetical protein